MESDKLRCADALVKILALNGVKFIFGHPGEQILPFYDALRESKITHILMRHEQGAAHAADGYARASTSTGVCIATGGPGALNLVMGVATAYKDSVPLIVITGDVSSDLKGRGGFQDIDVCGVFKPITVKSHHITDPNEGILLLRKVFQSLNYKKGPFHLNFPKDVLESYVYNSVLTRDVNEQHSPEFDFKAVKKTVKLIENSKNPLILSGAGVLWSRSQDLLLKFAEKHNIPVTTTYHARGVIPEGHPLSLGMIGLRGTDAANYAGKNSDVIICLGCRLSERTTVGIGDAKIIHVNIDEKVLDGDINIQLDVEKYLETIMEIKTFKNDDWLSDIVKYSRKYKLETDFHHVPIKPQTAIKEILEASENSVIVNDAGSHTTWVTLLMSPKIPSSLLFSGGFGPMGYGIPGAIGASLANPNKSVVAIVGDGDFQMTSQELATIKQYDLPILICILNNSSLRIIKQWQEIHYKESFQVQLDNPDFVKLSEAYHIPAMKLDSPGDVRNAVQKALSSTKPYLIEILVDEKEEIPLPEEL